MGAYTRTYSFTDGTTAYGSQVAFELDALGSSVNNIVNAQISSGAAIADTKLAQITTAAKISGAAITLLTSLPSGAGEIPIANIPTITTAKMPTGTIVQVIYAQTTALVTVNASIPYDNTKPQITEGVEVITATITPTSATNKLLFIFGVSSTSGSASNITIVALFQDAGANAIAATAGQHTTTSGTFMPPFVFQMTAPGTSAYTFRIRMGSNNGTLYVNADGGGTGLYNGVSITSLTILEVKA